MRRTIHDILPPEEPSRYVNVLIPDVLLSKIDKYRYDSRFPSRTATILWLLARQFEPAKFRKKQFGAAGPVKKAATKEVAK